MRAVRLHEIDRERGPQLFRVEQVDDPAPGPGETLVAIKRAAFNRRDVFISQGLYPGIQLPCIPGSDGVGTVAGHGEGVRGLAVGQRVVIDPTLGWGDDERIWSSNRDGLYGQRNRGRLQRGSGGNRRRDSGEFQFVQ